MKAFLMALSVAVLLAACLSDDTNKKQKDPMKEDNKALARLFDQYYEDRLQLFPLEATAIGDKRYNDLLPVEFTDSYRDSIREFYKRYRAGVIQFDRDELNVNDQTSTDVFLYETEMNLESLNYPENYFPFHQMSGIPLTLGQYGSGTGTQPFKTVKDYEDWLKRASAFPAWADSAITYFSRGISNHYVLPRAVVVKMIPQLNEIQSADVRKSIFYGPILNIPASFSETDKKRFEEKYIHLIKEVLEPAYRKLSSFLQQQYLPKARQSSGVNALPDGDAYYKFLVRQQTTTEKTPNEIYETGLREVARIRALMDSVKNATGFKGGLPAFFEYMRTNRRFMPYKTPGDVLDAFEKIHQIVMPHVKNMFNKTPRAPFEIRQTEAFRAASASAEYVTGSPDGSRPGVFYVPILDATTFNITSGMESLFLHEAIPGHHYQISLQQEDSTLPGFRRFGFNNAYAEGWALYCESLGNELGLYTDPYQYMGALGDEMHRAIRLVVDVAIHTKGMTREQAIKYMMDNQAISEEGATAEIERYMVMPGQALGYKIGALKIIELREKYEKQLGDRFSLATFHDQLLNDGSLPLSVLEKKLDAWAAALKKE